MTVAALYIDPRGPYPQLLGQENCWDESRDALTYAGPGPVVVHPPCGPWGKLRHMYRGTEHECAPLAVQQVRQWGGVLEHPAHSKLWAYCGLPRPGEAPDAFGGWSVELNQCDWGHVARKRTWIYIVGTENLPPWPEPREPTHWITGGRGRGPGRTHTPVPPGIKVCSAQQRRRTPRAFAEWLIALARLTES